MHSGAIEELKFDTETEEIFHRMLIDFELTSMIKKVESQFWVKTYRKNRRIDFILTLPNNAKIFIELDGDIHDRTDIKMEDAIKNSEFKKMGIQLNRIKVADLLKNKEKVADRIQSLIELLNGD